MHFNMIQLLYEWDEALQVLTSKGEYYDINSSPVTKENPFVPL